MHKAFSPLLRVQMLLISMTMHDFAISRNLEALGRRLDSTVHWIFSVTLILDGPFASCTYSLKRIQSHCHPPRQDPNPRRKLNLLKRLSLRGRHDARASRSPSVDEHHGERMRLHFASTSPGADCRPRVSPPFTPTCPFGRVFSDQAA